MSIALPQITDAQLTELGWTAGQIKEVRKYLKIEGHNRNAHQRGLCRRYSDTQRQLAPVATPKAKADRKGQVKARKSSSRAPWTLEEATFLVELYLQHVDVTNNRYDRLEIGREFDTRYTRRGLGISVSKLAGWDKLYNVEGFGPSNRKGVLWEAAVALAPERFV